MERLRWGVYALEAVALSYWLAKEGFTHLHCHFGNSASNTAKLAARIAGIPFSITVHGSELNTPEKFMLGRKLHDSKFIACISKFGMARMMMVSHRDDWKKLELVRCGPETLESPPVEKFSTEFSILCVARISKEKGHPILLDALEVLSKQGVTFHCTLVGDGPLKSDLESEVEARGMADHFTFTGSLEPAAVEEHYRSASVVVLASLSEGVPVVLMEALANRCPVVATNVGGVTELVEHNVTGLVVPPADATALAQAIRRIHDAPAEAKAMAERGRERVLEEFSVETTARRLKTLFETD